MARHAAVDISLVFQQPPAALDADRLPAARLEELRTSLSAAGMELRDGPSAATRLAALREMYEPFVHSLARYFLFPLPPIFPEKAVVDNWQTSAWTSRIPGFGTRSPGDEHSI